jgi:hypothetical protein
MLVDLVIYYVIYSVITISHKLVLYMLLFLVITNNSYVKSMFFLETHFIFILYLFLTRLSMSIFNFYIYFLQYIATNFALFEAYITIPSLLFTATYDFRMQNRYAKQKSSVKPYTHSSLTASVKLLCVQLHTF